jgi:hypothetical protein
LNGVHLDYRRFRKNPDIAHCADVAPGSAGVPAGISSIADEDVGAPSNGVPAGNSSIAD